MAKYALITGAASGIGYQMALALYKRGYSVIGVSIESDAWGMKLLQQQVGFVPIILDITDIEGIKKAVVQVTQITGGKLDILYNNAGISIGGPAIDCDDLKLQSLFNVNVLGHMYMTKYFADLVINAKGTIVFTSSVAARVPLSWASAYCATKAAIDQYAFVLRGEMKPFGVKVYSVITGGVDTAICDSCATSCVLSDRYDVDGLHDSLRSSGNMSRNPRTSISAAKYAEQVARQITKKRDIGFNIYRGFAAYALHLLRWYFPVWFVEWGIQFHFKQRAVFRAIAKKVRRQDGAKLK